MTQHSSNKVCGLRLHAVASAIPLQTRLRSKYVGSTGGSMYLTGLTSSWKSALFLLSFKWIALYITSLLSRGLIPSQFRGLPIVESLPY